MKENEIILDGSLMMGGDWDYELEQEIVDFVKQNLLGPLTPQKFLSHYSQYWGMMGEAGGDSENIKEGLMDHITEQKLTVAQALDVWKIYWDDNLEEEDIEAFVSDCIIVLVRSKFAKHPGLNGWENEFKNIFSLCPTDGWVQDLDKTDVILNGAEDFMNDI